MDLSIVIITRNEEATIGACIESVLKHTAGVERELILVDSASTEQTVEIAGRYPVKIVCIDPSAELSPAAGRYLGTLHATGKYVLFLDGDNILIEGWVENVLSHFDDEKVAAVAGKIYEVYPGEEMSYKHQDRLVPGKASYLPTAGMYRRGVLQRVGSFNPFVHGEEERELGLRIRQAGFSILRLDVPMIFHMFKERTKSEMEEKAGYFTGIGQIFRRYGLRSISWDLLFAHRNVLAIQTLAPFMACLALAFFLMELYLHFMALVGAVALFILLLVALKGWKKVYLFFWMKFLKARNIVNGFRRGIPEAGEFWAKTSVLPGRTTGVPGQQREHLVPGPDYDTRRTETIRRFIRPE